MIGRDTSSPNKSGNALGCLMRAEHTSKRVVKQNAHLHDILTCARNCSSLQVTSHRDVQPPGHLEKLLTQKIFWPNLCVPDMVRYAS